ncbi:MAG: hypothetical protein ABSF16_08955 [Terracidiphilus sp.]
MERRRRQSLAWYSSNVKATTETASGLPSNGETVYARLYSLIDGVWQYANYTYTAF